MCDHQEITEVEVLGEDVIIKDDADVDDSKQKDEGEVNEKEKQSPWKKIFKSSR